MTPCTYVVCANLVDWQIPKYGMFHILDPEVVVMFKKGKVLAVPRLFFVRFRKTQGAKTQAFFETQGQKLKVFSKTQGIGGFYSYFSNLNILEDITDIIRNKVSKVSADRYSPN